MVGNSEKIYTGNDIIDKLNVRNAKIIALCLVAVFTVFHGIRHLKNGVNSCTLIMTDGRYHRKTEWQPYGCMMHNYSEIDAKRCLKLHNFLGQYNRVIFIGDQCIFQLYGAFIKNINNKKSNFKHKNNQYYTDNHLSLKVEYISTAQLGVPFETYINSLTHDKNYPSLVVLGFGVENVLKVSGASFNQYQLKYNLTKIIPNIDTLTEKNAKVIWALQEPVNNANLNKQEKWRGILNNSIIDLYNSAAMEILQMSKADIFISNRKLSAPFLDDMKDGMTLFSDHLAKRSGAQILFNAYCNDHMNFHDGSCCSSAEQHTPLQIITFSLLILCFILGVVAVLHEKHKTWRRKLMMNKESATQSEFALISFALAKLALIMVYFYICDRTNFFMKETKHFTQSAFWIPATYLLCVGLFFTEHSRFSKVLHRDQTDEWKGWMQIIILIYHWTNAQEMLPLYMLGRVLVSSYVFLSGYGHFYYFWQSGDGSLIRFCRIHLTYQNILLHLFGQSRIGVLKDQVREDITWQCKNIRNSIVLFKLNFMQFILCLCMNRPYQSYEFIPLISFWFLMIYIFLVLPPRITSSSSESHPIQYLYLVLKFVGLFGTITTLYMSEVFFEKIFVTRPWKALFVTADDDITLWWQGWKRERYGVMCGMMFSVSLLLAQRYNLLDDNNHNNLFSNGISLTATLVSLIGIASYISFVFLCTDLIDCNEIHSYATFIPIISYIVLRNISGALRTRYSTFFAWFGKISLELLLGQFHIWLAADLNGILVLLPKYTNLNVFLTSFIFVCAAHEVHEITNTLTPYAVPSDLYSLSRNLLIFFTILIPIGVHAGMF